MPSAIYASLASGAGNPIRCHESSCDISLAYLAITVILILVTSFIRVKGLVLLQLILLSFGFLILAMIGYTSYIPLFVYSKAWGAFIASGFALLFMVYHIQYEGYVGLAHGFVRIMLMVLGLTFLFKAAQSGLMDRDVPYLLNGPIVFGWLMGIGALSSVYILILERSLINLLIAISLFLAVIWSGSKGPILAYLLSAIFMYVVIGGFRFGRLMQICIFLTVVTIAVILSVSTEKMLDSRLGLLFDIYMNGVDYSEGSVGVRLASYESSLQLISENLFSGIGPGAFAKYEPELMYPHNVHLEVLLESGLMVFAVYAALVVYGVIHGNPLIRSIIIFFVICMSFSGDVSYLRYLMPFLLLNILYPNQANE